MFKLCKIIGLTSLFTCSVFSYAESINRTSSPKDLGIVNKDRIIYWLVKRGELSVNASDPEKQQAFNRFIAHKFHNHKLPKALSTQLLEGSPVKRLSATPVINSVDIKSGIKKQFSNNLSANRAPEDVSNTIKVLAITIDFQDLKHDNHGLSSSDTDMYYPEYPLSHYNDLLFSATGFSGPSNQNIESAYQYYQHESGKTFDFNGDVYGWVTADNDAKFYGANDNTENDNNVRELVIEAVEKTIAQNQIDLSDYDKVSIVDHDGDGNLDEPDGIVDHLMIFHSSIGEEAGGGDLGSDAIWSHKFSVFDDNFQPVSIEGSSIKLFSYTITPIDASPGVIVHEFGHVLGVPDEYDTGSDDIGAPVQAWSVMGSGSWLGSPRGSKPVSFSPYAREYFQNRYGGNWINQQTVTLSGALNETLTINSATNHTDGVNQVRIDLPSTPEDFGQPFAGAYQYYSNTGNNLTNALTFNTTLNGNNPILSMKARWDIEQDYDYAQVKVNNQVIRGNHTSFLNSTNTSIRNYISGKSLDILGASQPLGWVDLTYDLSNYANQNVNITVEYKTDNAVSGYGLVIDELSISSNNSEIFSHGAENLSPITLNGFSRISNTIDGAKRYYYVQLRDHTITDSALGDFNYDPGILLWYRDEGVENNNVSQHAGDVFIGVVDADQNLIKRNNIPRITEVQLRDAAFSLFAQTPTFSDSSLTNTTVFNDKDDYSSPLQPESGIKLPTFGLNMEIISQASNNATATILLTKSDTRAIVKSQSGLTIDLSVNDEDTTATSHYIWQMGDGTQLTGKTVTHTYTSAGEYNISVLYSTSMGDKNLSQSVTLSTIIAGSIRLSASNTELSFSSTLSGGSGDYIYRWVFGDNIGSSTKDSGVYNYQDAGVYTVTLVVTDITGETFSFNESIVIDNPLISTFTSSQDNLVVNFTSNNSGGSKPYSYLWDFGDTQTSTEVNPRHTYSAAGSYAVKLTITDADNATKITTNNILVSTAQTTTSTTSLSSDSVSSSDSGGSIHWLALLFIGLFINIKQNR